MTPTHILLIDNDQDVLIWSSYILRSGGYQVHTASNFSESIRKLEKQRPDLVLMNLFLPDADAATAIKEIRRRPETCNVPILVHSPDQEDSEAANDALAAGGDIIEEGEGSDLLDRVRKHLSRVGEEGLREQPCVPVKS